MEEKWTWNGLSIRQYKEMLALDNTEDKIIRMAAIFEDIPVEEVMSQPIEKSLHTMSSMHFMDTPPKRRKIKSKYVLGGQVYELSSNPADITTAQYFDFINVDKKMPDNLSQVLAIFLVPEGKSYNDGYDLRKAVNDIENNLGVEDGLSIMDFFTTLSRLYFRKLLRTAMKALKTAKRAGVDPQKIEEVKSKLDEALAYIKYFKW